jgi:hypothetical protein
MTAPQPVVRAVQAAIVASAHLTTYEHVGAAAQACARLGSLTSGRWRSAARDLDALREELERAFPNLAEAVTAGAEEIGASEDALWTVGNAAGTLDLLREAALDEVEEDDAATENVLRSQTLLGASFLEDADQPNRGTTLIFGWPHALLPATWPWQANWVVGDGQDASPSVEEDGQDTSEDEEDDEELDLFEAGELEVDEAFVGELARELRLGTEEARAALRGAAMALTRASLLAAVGDDEDEDEDEDQDDEDYEV